MKEEEERKEKSKGRKRLYTQGSSHVSSWLWHVERVKASPSVVEGVRSPNRGVEKNTEPRCIQ